VSPQGHSGSVTRPHRVMKGAGGRRVLHTGEASRGRTRLSSHMAVATKEQPVSVRETKMSFWDGMEHTFMMPSITAKGTGIHCDHRSLVMADSCSIAWARVSTAAISGLSPSGAGDSNDTLHLPMRHSSGGVGWLRAGRRRV